MPINNAYFVGRISSDFYTYGEPPKAMRFHIACNGTSYSQTEQQWIEEVEYFPFILFGEKRIEAFVNNLKKGDQIAIQSTPRQNRYIDDNGDEHVMIDFQILEYRIGNQVKRTEANAGSNVVPVPRKE